MEIMMNLQFTHSYWVILLPLILMCLDILTGYYNAWKKHQISSSRMRDGLGKKLAEIVYIIIGILCTTVFGMKSITYFISLYVVYMEFISIAENCKKLGVKMPQILQEKLNNKKEEK